MAAVSRLAWPWRRSGPHRECLAQRLRIRGLGGLGTEAPAQPETAGGNDHNSQVRAFGSLAQEVMEAGVGGVVAMRYNVYVVTAAQMVGELYGALARGRELGERQWAEAERLQSRTVEWARERAAGALTMEPEDALEYAHAALRGFEAYGDRAAEEILDTQKLIEEIRE